MTLISWEGRGRKGRKGAWARLRSQPEKIGLRGRRRSGGERIRRPRVISHIDFACRSLICFVESSVHEKRGDMPRKRRGERDGVVSPPFYHFRRQLDCRWNSFIRLVSLSLTVSLFLSTVVLREVFQTDIIVGQRISYIFI